MMNEKQRKNTESRLKKIEGQIRGIVSMIQGNRYCMDILSQTRAVAAALRKVEDIIMEQHLHTCVAESMRSRNSEDKTRKINEIMDIFSTFRNSG